jgi:hypothetical protein
VAISCLPGHDLWFRYRFRSSVFTTFSPSKNHIEIILKIRKICRERVVIGLYNTTAPLPRIPSSWVIENRIGLIDELESLFGNRIIAIEIRMPTTRFSTESSFELRSIAIGTDPK